MEPHDRPDFLAPDLSYTLLVPVDYVIGVEPHTLRSVTFRRPTGNDGLIYDRARRMVTWLELMACMCGVLEPVALKMDQIDIVRTRAIIDWLFDPASIGVEMPGEEGGRPAWLDADNSFALLGPIGTGENAVSRLNLRRMTGVDCQTLEGPGLLISRLADIVERMTGIPRATVLTADYVDLQRVDAVFGFFMEPGSIPGAT